MAKIIINPKIMLGKPTVAGTRITVELILKLLAQKLSFDEILEDYPHLTEADIKAAVVYAAKQVAKPDPRAIKYWDEVSRGRKLRDDNPSKTERARV